MTHHSEEPASTLIRYLGGVYRVALIVGKHPSRVYRWTYPVTKREGLGGLVPAKDQRRILEFAKAQGIDIRPADFHSEGRLRDLMGSLEAAE